MLNILLFFSTYIGGFIASFALNPAYSFVLYEAVYFFYPQRKWWGQTIPDISYSFYTVLLMMAVFAISYKKLQQNKIFATPQFRWVYFILLLFGMANFYAISPERHYEAFIIFLKLVIIMTLAYKIIDNNEKLNLVLWGYIYGAWYQSFVVWQIGRNVSGRVEGLGPVDAPDANGLASTLAPAIVLSLHYFWITKNIYVKFILVIAGAFIANAIILINSRGAFLGVAVSISFYMYYLYFATHRKQYQRIVAVFITAAGLAGVVYLADESFVERMLSIDDQSKVDVTQQTGATRMIFWAAAWEMGKDYPFGNGFQGFNYLSHLYIPEGVDTGGSRNRTVHSTWMEALTEIGYAGLFAFILMIWSSYKTTNKCKKALAQQEDYDNYYQVIAIQAAGICFIVTMTFLNRMRADILYWLILYSAIAYNIYIVKPSLTKATIKNAA